MKSFQKVGWFQVRTPRRNMSKIFYSLYIVDSSAKDKWGNTIGKYSEPIPMNISLSVEKGSSNNEVFGQELDYDREMVTTKMTCPIDEYSRLWIDTDITEPHDYIVKKVAKSKNQKRYAIKRVDTDYVGSDYGNQG